MTEVVVRLSDWPQRALLGMRVVLAVAIAWLATAVVHETLVLVTALVLPNLATSWLADQFVRLAPINRIYAQAMVDMAGTVAPMGLAVPAPFGSWIHAVFPFLFVSAEEAVAHRWVSAVIAPGSTLPARLLVSAVADVLLLAAGLGMTVVGTSAWRTARQAPALVAAGLTVQSVVVASTLDTPLTAQHLEAIGVLPFLYHELLHLPITTYDRAFDILTRIQPLVTFLGIAGLYVPAGGLVGAGIVLRRWRSAAGGRQAAGSHRSSLLLPAAIALAVGVSPVGGWFAVETQFLDTQPGATGERDAVAIPVVTIVSTAGPGSDLANRGLAESLSTAAMPAPIDTRPVPRRPITVRVSGRDGQFSYFAGGAATTVRSIGYNVVYAGLPPAERAARYQRDFTALREMGVNTVSGWRPVEFDDVLLDAAYRAGLGVMLPYDLDPSVRYGDPAVRQAIMSDVLAWVERYRRHPAVRMWAIGNETLMVIKDSQRARAFAEFYADLVLLVLSADRDHPVIYRDAEDVYLPPLREAMGRRGGPPVGFVYGMNFYTFRLKDVLAEWPKKRFDVPVMVSEYAPAGLSRNDRPDGFRRMWTIIQSSRAFVIGAAPYAWTTEGPEPSDRLFGFVDASGRPLDSTVNAFRELYRTAAALESAAAAAVPPLAGLTEAEAAQELARAGLAVGPTEYLPIRDVRDVSLKARAVPGRVFAQQPASGMRIAPDVRVRLTVISPESRRPGRFPPE
ncbi:MAG: hypothetical protein HY331_09800 [Chloroflexi bacterium]|nr:hypothetical protein [Chloroflexota bacterium]